MSHLMVHGCVFGSTLVHGCTFGSTWCTGVYLARPGARVYIWLDLVHGCMSVSTLVDRATDPALTTDNWEYILDVCDAVLASPEQNTRAAVAAVGPKLTSPDANVVLRALSLLVALAENCGLRLKNAIATRDFVEAHLLPPLASRQVHRQVKVRVAGAIEQLAALFALDPLLKPMQDAYAVVKLRYAQYLELPQKPAKQAQLAADVQQEEREMQRALQLLVQEFEREQSLRTEKPLPQPAAAPTSRNDDLTIADVKKVRALYDLISYEPEELSFRKGDTITVIESVYRDWWRGRLPSGEVGIFPLNYVAPVVNKLPQEAAHEHAVELRLLGEYARKVDALLAMLLAPPETVDEDAATLLYNEVTPLKRELVAATERYSTRKDELRALNDQLSLETALYHNLLDSATGYNREAVYPRAPYLEQQPTSAGFGNAPT